jgi:hypothetical protein
LSAPGSWIRAAIVAVAALGLPSSAAAAVLAPDSLVLQAPREVKVRSVYDPGSRHFVLWLTWREAPDNLSAFIAQPDTTGYRLTSPPGTMSRPRTRGTYLGDIDRTVVFAVNQGGVVGTDSIRISYSVRREESVLGSIVLLPGYSGSWFPVGFRNIETNQNVDFGLELGFTVGGNVDRLGTFSVGLVDFEGYHIWRGIEPDGSDLTVIGELSKEEAFKGRITGGSLADSVYFYDVIPTLRSQATWFSRYGAIDCLGTRVDLPLESDQLFWYDCNANNGFTYYYMVTEFDRGYTASSSAQGLNKFDDCPVAEGTRVSCPDRLVAIGVQVDPQNNLNDVYAVPNPFRTGGSRLTSENYHNFPAEPGEEYVFFVNVPATCTLRVYTVSGDLVWEKSVQNGTGGNIRWDVRNRSSEPVASGVYIYRVVTPSGGSVYGRLAVIR